MKADQLIRTIEIKDARGRVVGTKDVVTYQGLLSKAHDEGLKAIRTRLVRRCPESCGICPTRSPELVLRCLPGTRSFVLGRFSTSIPMLVA